MTRHHYTKKIQDQKDILHSTINLVKFERTRDLQKEEEEEEKK